MKYLALLFLTCVGFLGFSQEAVVYDLEGTYDPETQSLQVRHQVVVANRLDKPLDRLAINFYADALADRRSYFTQLLVEDGYLHYYFDDQQAAAGYRSVDFRQEGRPLVWEKDDDIPEVRWVTLARPIAPGSQARVEINYKLHLPPKRMTQGYENDSTAYFDLWYPTLADYVDGGYLLKAYEGLAPSTADAEHRIGLEVPKGHYVALQGASVTKQTGEAQRVEVRTRDDYPLPMVITKRPYKEVNLEQKGRSIPGYAIAQKGAEPLAKDLWAVQKEMQNWLGPVPTDQIVVVQQLTDSPTISRGGLVTIRKNHCDDDLAEGLANLFLSPIFGADVSPSHRYALVRLYAQRYVSGGAMLTTECDDCSMPMVEAMQYYEAATTPLPMAATPEDYRHSGDRTILVGAYPMQLWKHAYQYTQATWDAAMVDLRALGEPVSIAQWVAALSSRSEKDLSWIKEVIAGGQVDYAIKYKANAVQIINRGDVAAPIPLHADLPDGHYHEWLSGVDRDTVFLLPGAEGLQIDPDRVTMDVQPHNNRPLFTSRSKENIFTWREQPSYRLGLLPGYNLTDRLTLGPVLFSDPEWPTKWQFHVAPMWSFGVDDLVGMAHLRYNHKLRADKLDRLSLGLSFKHFHFDRVITSGEGSVDEVLGFYRLQPYAELFFDGGARTRSLFLGATYLTEEGVLFGSNNTSRIQAGSRFLQARWQDRGYGKLRNTDYQLALEFGDYQSAFRSQEQYLKLAGELLQSWAYSPHYGIQLRVWGAAMLDNTVSRRDANARAFAGVIALSHQPFNDYTYAEHHVDRNSNAAFFTRQVNAHRGGGFTHATGAPFNALIGQSQRYAFSSNLAVDLPIGRKSQFLQATVDIGGYSRRVGFDTHQLEWLYSVGLRLDFDEIQINLPILYSDAFSQAYSGRNVLDRITFSIDYTLTDSWTRSFEKIKQ